MFIDFSVKRAARNGQQFMPGMRSIQDHISLPLVHSDEFRPVLSGQSHRPPVLWFPALKTFPLIFQNPYCDNQLYIKVQNIPIISYLNYLVRPNVAKRHQCPLYMRAETHFRLNVITQYSQVSYNVFSLLDVYY